MPATAKPKRYNPRHPERTLLYQTVAEHYESWLELACEGQFEGQGDHHSPRPYVRKAFEKYLECGIFAHGFARARCDDCGHDFLVAFSCKGRGVCPSCNTRRMAETAAHLTDHVFPRLPVRQWVLSVPKRLRYYMQREGPVLGMVLRIFLRVIAQTLQANSPGAANVDKAALHIGAVAFIHRFGSSLNEHVHFHVCAVDGVFEEVAGEEGDAADAASQSSPSRIIFHPATGVTADAVGQVQASLRKRILRAFVGRGLLESFEAQEMLGYKHSGFSADTSVCIAAHDRAGLERLLRYCARPPFAMERLRKAGSELVYRCAKQHSEPGSLPHNKRGVKADEITLTPLELIERIAKLVPPPRTHRHRYFGVLAPNSPLRPAVTALARDAAVKPAQVQAEPASTAAGEGALGVRSPLPTQTEPAQPVPPKRPAHYLWAVLMARIYEVLSTRCSRCCAPSAAGKCTSSPSSHTVPISAKYWSTSGWRRSRRTSPRHAGRHCGTSATRKPQRAWSQPQTGMKRPNRPRTSRSISASVGRVATAVNSGFANVARQRCACHRQKRVIPKNLGQLALRNQPSSPLCACLRRPKRVPYLCSCGWISYPPEPCTTMKALGPVR